MGVQGLRLIAFFVMVCGVFSVVDSNRYSSEATYTLIVVMALLIPLTVIQVLRKAGQKTNAGEGVRPTSFDFKQRTTTQTRLSRLSLSKKPPEAWGTTDAASATAPSARWCSQSGGKSNCNSDGDVREFGYNPRKEMAWAEDTDGEEVGVREPPDAKAPEGSD